MPLSYSDLSDIYDSLSPTESLPEWSRKMNQVTGTNNYDRGVNDNWLKRRSRNLDQILEYTGLPNLLGSAGAGIGGLLGNEEYGRQLGHGALRTVVDFLPMLAGGLPGAIGSGILSGIKSYSDSGSARSGLISGATAAVMPGVAHIAEQGVLKGLGANLIKGPISRGAIGEGVTSASEYIPKNIPQGLAGFAAANLAAGGVGEISNAVDAAFDPNRDYTFDPSKAFLDMTLGQLPFAAHYFAKGGLKQFGGKQARDYEATLNANIDSTKQYIAQKQAQNEAGRKNPLETIPDVTNLQEPNAVDIAQAKENTDKILGRIQELRKTPTPESEAEVGKLSQDYADLQDIHGDLLKDKPLELPITNPNEKPIFSDLEKNLHEATNAADTAKTEADFHLAIGAVNQINKQLGLKLLSPERIAQIAANKGLTQTQALKSVSNKTKRILESLQTEQESERIKNQENVNRGIVASTGGDVSETLGDNLGTVNGTPIMSVPKENKVNQPIHDLIDEVISGVTGTKGQQDFEKWSKENGQPGSVGEEQERYKIYRQLREDGDIARTSKLNKDDQEVLNDTFGDEGLRVDNSESLENFPSRPHIQTWDQGVNQRLLQKQLENGSPSPGQRSSQLPAGGGFVYDLRPQEEIPGVGKKPMYIGRFKNSAKTIGKGTLSDAEIDTMRLLVPEAFSKNKEKGTELEFIDVPKLYEGLKKNGPVVEIKKLGAGGGTPEQQRFAQLQHIIDSHPEKRNINHFLTYGEGLDRMSPEAQTIAKEFDSLNKKDLQEGVIDARYSFLGPKSKTDMPGYVEGLVRVPLKYEKTTYPEGDSVESAPTKYVGPHFGSEDTNVLAFFRGYEETLPSGEKAFHVIEVQSDWGQGERSAEKAGLHNLDKTGHPLLPSYESLALKAAIDHARSIGATKIILSDAETAMMTEGHDKAHHVETSDREASLIPQEKGMRRHYDTTLPSAMEKLTGDKGREVEVGVHKQAQQERPRGMVERQPFEVVNQLTGEVDVARSREDAEARRLRQANPDNWIVQENQALKDEGKLVGSPVFRDRSGNPKTQITGRIYDLGKANETISNQGGMTLTDPSRSAGLPHYEPTSPEEASRIEDLDLGRGGLGLADHIASDTQDPITKAVINEIRAKYPEQLKRTNVIIRDPSQPSSAYMNPKTRQGTVALGADLLSAPKEVQHTVALHELIHQISQGEIDNPTKAGIIENLDSLRQRMIDALPKELKAAYDKAVSSNWIEAWKNGTTNFKSLHPDYDKANLLYGLLNTKEFVAQGFGSSVGGSPALRNYMLSQKGKSQGWFGKFMSGFKKLLGFGEGTAYDEFLKHTNALFDQGEYVADFFNFANRFFEGKGVDRILATAQTQRAMGLLHEINTLSTGGSDLLATLDSNGYQKTPEEARAGRNLDRSIINKDDDFQQLAMTAKELGFEPTKQGVEGFLQEALNGTSSTRKALDVLPEVATRHMFARLHSMRDVLESLQAAGDEQNKGLLNLTNPKLLRGPVNDAIKKIDKVLDSEAMLDHSVSMIQNLFATAPEGYKSKLVVAAPKWSDASPGPEILGNFLDGGESQPREKGFWKRMGEKIGWALKPFNQYEDPATQELATRMRQLPANVHAMEREGMKFYATNFDTGEIGTSQEKMVEKLLSNDPVIKVANKIIYQNQVANKNAVTRLPWEDSRIAPILANLSQEQQKQAKELVMRHGFAHVGYLQQVYKAMSNVAVIDAAGLLNKVNNLRTTDNMKFAQNMWEAMSANKNDPVAMQKVGTDMAAIQEKLGPANFNLLYKFIDNQFGLFSKQKEFWDANPNWSTAKRYGQYLVELEYPNGKKETQGVDSQKEANEMATKMGAKVTSFESTYRPGDEEIPHVGTDIAKLTEDVKRDLENELDIRRAFGASADEIEFSRRISSANQFIKKATAQGLSNVPAPARQLNRGAENVPFIGNQFQWFKGQSRYWQRRLVRSQTDALINEQQTTPELRQVLSQQRDNFLQLDPQAIKTLNNIVRPWYLGGNIASAFLNGFQTLFTHIPELTNITGKPVDSYKRISSAIGELADHHILGKEWQDPEVKQFFTDAQEAGEVKNNKFDDDAALQEATTANFLKAVNSNRPKTWQQQAGTLWGNISKASMAAFQATESFNSRLALLTGFKLFRDQGLSYEEARDKAFTYNSQVNFTGGKASRPVGLFSSKSPTLRGAAIMGTMMQSYVMGTMAQLGRFVQRGFFNGSKLTPGERWAARKALVQSLGTQLLAAGVLGLPFVSATVGLFDKMFPDAEINKGLRANIKSLFGEDDENGGLYSDIAMTGLPSMLGWDMQSRLSMGNNLPGVSEANGFQPEQLLGPPVNMIKDFVKGTVGMINGSPNSGTALVPPALRKLQQLISNDGSIRDYKARPVLNDLTPGEKLGVGLGFNPKRLSDFNAAGRIADQSELNNKRDTYQFNQKMAEEATRGNFGTIRNSLRDKKTADPNFDPVSAVEDISRVAEELTFPRDLRREGSDPNKSKTLQLFNLSTSIPSEQLRFQFRSRIQQALGLMSQSPREQQLALIMDKLRVAQPSASRAELRQQSELLLRHTTAQSLQE